jgi:hypothetical protein
MNRLLFAVCCVFACAGPASAASHVVPAEFVGDRVFVVVPVPQGPAVRFFTDSGSGWNAISQGAVKRLAMEEQGKVQLGQNEDTIRPLVGFPVVMLQAGVPAPGNDPFYRGGLVVIADNLLTEDGVFGSRWFAGHVWEIDYGQHTLKVLDKAAPANASHHVPIGFRAGEDGKPALDFPRVTVSVDGEPIEMLLDTGATATTTEASAAVLKVPAGTRIATSFIDKSVFDRWTSKHPDWLVIAAADVAGKTTFPMIEVPRITIAGLSVGPVWFVQRPDEALREMLSQMTDKPVDGALGGTALRHFRVTLDYPGAVAYFEQIERPTAR